MATNKTQAQKNFYNKSELQEFEDIIQAKLTESREEYKRLAASLKDFDGSSDHHNDFGGTLGREKEQTEILMARQEKFVFNLENALVRIRNGTYGICKVTGKLIAKERLKIVPHTTTSIEAKLKQNNRPVSRG